MDTTNLEKLTVADLRKEAERLGFTGLSKKKKQELIDMITAASQKSETVKRTEEPSPKEAAQKKNETEKAEKQAPKNSDKKADERKSADKKNEGKTAVKEKHETKANDRALVDKSKQERSALPQPVEKQHHNNHNNYNNHRYAKIKDNIEDSIEMAGPLEVLPEGFGFIKTPEMKSQQEWVYVSGSQIQKFKLETGDIVGGKVRKAKPGEKYAAMLFLEMVNGTQTSDIINKINSMLYADDKKNLDRFKNSQEGILDLNSDGFGFLRMNNYTSGDNDIYVAPNQIRRFNLRTGDKIVGKIRMPNEGEKFDALLYVETVNGDIPEKIASRPRFERLTPVFPEERITLETDRDIVSTRIIDIFSPMGKGQRGMIVAPPKAGKTTLLKEIAQGIRSNHPEIELIILLVDERPEEVTDMKRSIDADIAYSTFDQPPENHIRVAEIVLERGKRLVEQGKDVVVLVDSLTRLTRGNNLVVEPSGRTLTGGLDPESLYFPKKFFGSARNIEGGGSLTILATALVDTGSRMDDIIFEEFKGTGNMELHLERELAERRIFPAINLNKSGTRREEKLLTPDELKVSYQIRKLYAGNSPVQLTDKIINTLERTTDNEDFLKKILQKSKS
ncbi:transcription termination factor Rho [Eubacterium maltosivorans]|uniref:transcription termination factor Rho n=1 Tax=Eubacterium maltosivorans TaxID=2041044 RepID=UPI00087F1F82|nr:transcription termination factor Rho [Eubacterium maltosivorans]WPK81081.1 Transcription termination factor Rho [Eubacterium maltosivorans]SDO71670.1 transcription termination factor Rho [Eubacterium maltosivorans]